MTTPRPLHSRPARGLFVATILTGSFLLFLVQPMVARMALPRLGGAPNVWNSAMLVYQALLLAGYWYAHRLSRQPLARQVRLHLALYAVAVLTLPVGLVEMDAPRPGTEVFWVPALLALSIGPVFFLVSAQAPLMQRWFALHPAAGEPWALYAASNLGSFGGLIAYPLLVEPLLPLRGQSLGWSALYAVLLVLIALSARSRWALTEAPAAARSGGAGAAIPLRRILQWTALSAVPSGLMLSTTTHLTTDIFAMPLLWVIPLGLYLLSFTIAFAERRTLASAITAFAPFMLLLSGGTAMTSASSGTMNLAVAGVLLLFVLAVTLHGRLYDLRPDAEQLTLFYFVMSVGGALGGLFCALIAPMIFDWAWEHPILVLASALLLPLPARLDWRRLPGLGREMVPLAAGVVACFAALLCWLLRGTLAAGDAPGMVRLLNVGVALCGVVLMPWRWLYAALLAALMLANGGEDTLKDSAQHIRTRSYFGIYTVREYPDRQLRTLAHGTTLHGQQSLDPAHRRDAATYYGPGSGVGLAFAHAPQLFGGAARVGVVGLGTGTLACYHRPGQHWQLFEIDPAVLAYSQSRQFTFLADCAPDAEVTIGDARLRLGEAKDASFDLLAIDAFSSDSIPLHLLTDEALGTYLRVLRPQGLLLVHISNRHIDLGPVIAALARRRGLSAAIRHDNPADRRLLTPSHWVVLTRDRAMLDKLRAAAPSQPWEALPPPASRVWTDDHASVLPFVRWSTLVN